MPLRHPTPPDCRGPRASDGNPSASFGMARPRPVVVCAGPRFALCCGFAPLSGGARGYPAIRSIFSPAAPRRTEPLRALLTGPGRGVPRLGGPRPYLGAGGLRPPSGGRARASVLASGWVPALSARGAPSSSVSSSLCFWLLRWRVRVTVAWGRPSLPGSQAVRTRIVVGVPGRLGVAAPMALHALSLRLTSRTTPAFACCSARSLLSSVVTTDYELIFIDQKARRPCGRQHFGSASYFKGKVESGLQSIGDHTENYTSFGARSMLKLGKTLKMHPFC